MTPEETAGRFDNRAGYKLIAYGTVGLPLYRLTTVGLCLAKKNLDPIEEFVLRSVMAGSQRVEDAAGLLGLETEVVGSCLAELLRAECIKVSAGDTTGRQEIELTSKGRDLARDQEATVPIEQTVVFYVDGLTRAPRFYSAESLYRPRELKELGVPEIRAFPARAPGLDEIDIKDVIEVVRLDAGKAESPRQLLRINSIERRERVFLEAVALAYRPESGGTLQVGFAVDGRLSAEHETAFARAGGPERTKVFGGLQGRRGAPQMVEVLGEDLARRVEDAARVQGDAEELGREAGAVQKGREEEGHEGEQSRGGTAEEATQVSGRVEEVQAELEALAVRPLAVYEHAALLNGALTRAKERVLIISPWIRRAVVTREFVGEIRRALDRSVRVYIGYGLGEDDEREGSWDRDARKELQRLADEREHLVLKRLGDTHAKVLIQDRDFFVITSFNWLSFRGDPNRTFREEWGTLVAIPGVVEDYFEQMVQRFAVGEGGAGNRS